MQDINAVELAGQIRELQRRVLDYDGSYITVVQACSALTRNATAGRVTVDQAFASLKGCTPHSQSSSAQQASNSEIAALSGKQALAASHHVSDVVPDDALARVNAARSAGLSIWYRGAPI